MPGMINAFDLPIAETSCHRVILTGLRIVVAAMFLMLVPNKSTAQEVIIPSIDKPAPINQPIMPQIALPKALQPTEKIDAQVKLSETFPPFPERIASEDFPDARQRQSLLVIWSNVYPFLSHPPILGPLGVLEYDLQQRVNEWVNENFLQLQPIWKAVETMSMPTQHVLKKTHSGIAEFMTDLGALQVAENQRLLTQIEHCSRRSNLMPCVAPDAAAVAANPPSSASLAILQKRYYPALDTDLTVYHVSGAGPDMKP